VIINWKSIKDQKKKKFAIHPLFFAANSVLYYFIGFDYRSNKWDLFLFVILSLIIAICVWLLTYTIVKKFYSSALLTSAILVGFFYFDGIFELIVKPDIFSQEVKVFLASLTGQWILFILIAVVICLLFGLINRIRRDFSLVSFFFDIFALTLIINSIYSISWSQDLSRFVGKDQKLDYEWGKFVKSYSSSSSESSNSGHDIYYLLFDAYGGNEELKKIYDYSNDDLVNFLREKGFLVLQDGHTNYNQTRLSISSSLNMDYWQDILERVSFNKEDALTTLYATNYNAVFNFLRQNGYTIVTFTTGLSISDLQSSDVFISPPTYVSPLMNSIINNTALSLILWKEQYKQHTLKIENTINSIKKGVDANHPLFVYAHIMIPHPPFTYQENGDIIYPKRKFDLVDNNAYLRYGSRENYIHGYRNQIAYTDQQIKEIIVSILEKSPDSIIIIQGDHGPGAFFLQEDLENSNLDEKFHILNAYYFPDKDYQEIHEDITPVNSFRVVFNHFFGTDFKLLENRSFFSPYSEKFDFVDITDEVE
jgi:hypothetical protein